MAIPQMGIGPPTHSSPILKQQSQPCQWIFYEFDQIYDIDISWSLCVNHKKIIRKGKLILLSIFNYTCKESIADSYANHVEKDEKDLADLIGGKCHPYPL